MTDPADTRERLIVAAERLFVDEGEEVTSLRAVARAAHANAAAVHYHFGGREELLAAVAARHLGPLAARRRELLAAVADSVDPHAIVTAALRADVELLTDLRRRKVALARFLGRTALNRGGTAAVEHWCGAGFVAELIGQLRPALPLRAAEVTERVRLAFALVCALYAAAPEPGASGLVDADKADELLGQLSAFVVGGLTAPALRPARGRRPRDTHTDGGKRKKR